MTDNDQLRAGQKAQTNSARARTLVAPVIVSSDSVQYSEDEIISKYSYTDTKVTIGEDGTVTAFPQNSVFEFKTRRKVSRLGLMMVSETSPTDFSVRRTPLRGIHPGVAPVESSNPSSRFPGTYLCEAYV